jgi:hAT family C-terminal dimerisation region
MARDYLAIQGSATPSERAFSSGGTTGTAKRNRLKPEVFEALQLLKSAYRNGHLSADNDANDHLHSSIESDDDGPVDNLGSK